MANILTCEHDFSRERSDGLAREAVCAKCRIGIRQCAAGLGISPAKVDAAAGALLFERSGDSDVVAWTKERPDQFAAWQNRARLALVAAHNADHRRKRRRQRELADQFNQ